jgi:alpha-glucosidase
MARHSSSAAPDPGPLFASDPVPPGPLRSLRGTPRGTLELDFEHATGELAVARDGSVRVRLAPGSVLPPDLGPCLGRDPWPLAAIDARARGRGFVVACGGAELAPSIELDAEPFAVRIELRDLGPLATLDRFALRAEVGSADFGGGEMCLHSPPREHLFGLGQKRGPLDRRGRATLLRNQDPGIGLRADAQYSSIPFLLGHDVSAGRSRGVLLDTVAASFIDAACSDAETVRLLCAYGAVDVTIHPGPTPADVLRRFSAQVGRSPLPPRWALGHHQSRWSYGSERAVRRVASELRRHAMAADAIHLDIGHQRSYRVFSWHERRFPNPRRLVDELAEQGLRTVVSTHPAVAADEAEPMFQQGRDRDLFCRTQRRAPFTLRMWPGESVLPDFNRSEVREWWADQHQVLLEAGCAGVWLDMNEPSGWKRDLRLGPSGVPLATFGNVDWSELAQRTLGDEKESVAHESVRNAYGLQQCRASREALERARPEQRPFLLSRAGCQGIQRHAALWTGDSRSRFEDLRESVHMLLGLSISGVAFCGADIGGFAGNASRELFARWMQIGALQPFARTHSWWRGRRQEPWRFGRNTERIARNALALRMRLLPYLYSLFDEAAQTGAPVWRPLFHEFPDDGESVFCEDQIMLGPWLLAAPVLERGARSRDVYLPPGVWLDWHDDARHMGPKHLRVPAPLDRIPLFLRGGAALPTQSPELHTGAQPREPLVVEVAPGADGSFTLIEDDGITPGGPQTRTRLRVCDRRAGRLRLEISRREGGYDIGERDLRVCLRGVGEPSAVLLNGERVAEGHAVPGYRSTQGRVHVRLHDAGDVHTIEVEPAP